MKSKMREIFTDLVRSQSGAKASSEKKHSLTHAGDGHPVLVIPGFMNNDTYMSRLRKKISEQGYKAYGWEHGLNTGPSKKAAEHLEKKLRQIYEENGKKKVSIIGYSQGGIYARELARKYPNLVRQGISRDGL